MFNRDIYFSDPSKRKLVNEGVAAVNDDLTGKALDVLHYELETFVCEGQYEKGLEHILEVFLSNVNREQQPGVWVSGFFGSGKSHLVKMLRFLWMNDAFPGGTTPRGMARLSAGITDLLKQLDVEGKRHGGLHAASGTLSSASNVSSVRMALLNIILKSAGLPGEYNKAKLVLWLKKENLFDEVEKHITAAGSSFEDILYSFYVAEKLHHALVALKPDTFPDVKICTETLIQLFPNVNDVSNDQMIDTIREVLVRDGKFPLTVVILDELQQYIGEDGKRSNEIQEMVETCCKRFGSKLLFVGTGQTAVTGTSNLKKLEGRFTVRIELSDSDVDTVIRKVLLQKKPGVIRDIEKVMNDNIGEISRHLEGTLLGHRQEDSQFFHQDYPLLPVRRRFWENTLRRLDLTGTENQLRNQLTTVFNAIKHNLDKPLGHVIPADFIYFEIAPRFLSSRMLSKLHYDKTSTWYEKGTPDEKLMARACAVIFLINKWNDKARDNAPHLGTGTRLAAGIDAIADLLVEDLTVGSTELRNRLPRLLDQCEILVNVNGEYRLKTEESTHWNNEFQNQRSVLQNEQHRLGKEREERIKKKFIQYAEKVTIRQGDPKKKSGIIFHFDNVAPRQEQVCFWVRHEWLTDENTVRADARQGGNNSPIIYVFIPRFATDRLNNNILDYLAASRTLEIKVAAPTIESQEARQYIETIKQAADAKIIDWLENAFTTAKVFNGGGMEIVKESLLDKLKDAAGVAAERLFNKYKKPDGWDQVYARAALGDPDALKVVDTAGDIKTNHVCSLILNSIGAGKRGIEIWNEFVEPPYGWSKDIVDGALMVLYTAGALRVYDEHHKEYNVKSNKLERRQMGQALFKIEAVTLTVPQRLEIRKLMQKININAEFNKEDVFVPQFLAALRNLAEKAGGEPPKPMKPDTLFIDEFESSSGNAGLLLIHSRREEVSQKINEWKNMADLVEKRWPLWLKLQELEEPAQKLNPELDKVSQILDQIQAIKQHRLLIIEPDPISPLLRELGDIVRQALNKNRDRYEQEMNIYLQKLAQDESWQKLTVNEQDNIREESGIMDVPNLDWAEHEQLVKTLHRYPFHWWKNHIDALPGRIDRARERASRLLEPESQTVDIPRRTLKTENEIRVWLGDVERSLKEALSRGPVIIR